MTTVEEARRQHGAARPAAPQKPAPASMQYEQRVYTPEQLGALTNADLEKYMGEDKHGAS